MKKLSTENERRVVRAGPAERQSAQRVGAHLVITGEPCLYCGKLVPHSIASQMGSDENGYTCPDCEIKQMQDVARLSQALVEESNVETKVVISPGSPGACVLCGSTTSEYQRLVPIDGAQGFICAGIIPMSSPCEAKWATLNRDKLGRRAQHVLKLK